VSKFGGQFSAIPNWFLDIPEKRATDVLVLAVIHSFAGPSGRVYPSLQTIADKAGVSRRTVIETIRRLVDFGVLQKSMRVSDNGGQTSNAYYVRFDDPDVIDDYAPPPVQPAAPPSAASRTPLVKPAALPQCSQLHPKPEPIKPDLSTDVDSPNVASDVELAFAAYNQAADQADWPKARKPTKRRVSQLKARLAEAGGLDGWRAALRRAVGNPFFAGDNERGWKADLDFFLQEKSFTKLIEGSYDRKPPSGARATNSRPSGPHAQLFEAAARVADREQRGEL